MSPAGRSAGAASGCRAERVVVADPGSGALVATRRARAGEVPGRGRSSAARRVVLEQRAVVLEGLLQVRRAYAEPSRLQATRSALGAMAAVGSICSSVNCCTTGSSSVGRGASSSCARTAMRRACALVSRWTDREVRVGTSTVERTVVGSVFRRLRPCACACGREASRASSAIATKFRKVVSGHAPSRCRETTKDRRERRSR